MNEEGSRNGRTGQQLAPDSLGGSGGAAPRDSSSKDGDRLIELELNPVQSTTRGFHDPRPQSRSCAANKPSKHSPSKYCDDTHDTVSS